MFQHEAEFIRSNQRETFEIGSAEDITQTAETKSRRFLPTTRGTVTAIPELDEAASQKAG
jgi:hypothetical protein